MQQSPQEPENTTPASFNLPAIGVVHSCYKEKFGIPRQPGLAPASSGIIRLLPPYNLPDAVRGLEENSHIWVQFVFHQCLRDEWKPTVRPPRLGGNERLGVFATRATFRPNPLGLSVVKLEKVEIRGKEVLIHISGLDLVEGTPVLDIKPYIPYVDKVEDAKSAFAPEAPVAHTVKWLPQAESALERYQQQHTDHFEGFKALIEQVLQQDPRPAYRHGKSEEKVYGVRLLEANIRFQIQLSESSEALEVQVVNIEF